jgi:hypothetical protein
VKKWWKSFGCFRHYYLSNGGKVQWRRMGGVGVGKSIQSSVEDDVKKKNLVLLDYNNIVFPI